MQPHQERVVAERSDLNGKIDRLTEFLKGDTFKGLPQAEQYRLKSQLGHMSSYSSVLAQRIEAFKAA